MIKHTIAALLTVVGFTGLFAFPQSYGTIKEAPVQVAPKKSEVMTTAVHELHLPEGTSASNTLTVQEPIILSEVVISVPKAKKAQAVVKKEEPKVPTCRVRELVQGTGLVRICG